MAALELPVYPTRARCACTHALYAHTPQASRCAADGCSCRRFEAAGGLVPLEVEHVPPVDARRLPASSAIVD